MFFSSPAKLFVAAAFIAAVSAVDIPVTVGGPNGLVFSPSSVTANAGDTIVFTFGPKNHTVTQSSLTDPCSPLQGGFDTGFVPVDGTEASPRQAKYTVISTNPVWAYCRQAPPTGLSHCQSGMVFAINSPDDKFQQFVQTAKSGQAAPPAQSSGVSNPPTSTSTSTDAAAASSTPSGTTGTSGAPASGQTHTVKVGADGLVFTPPTLTANEGDTVLFQFYPKAHSVTQSTFGAPCVAGIAPGSAMPPFDSGFMPVDVGGVSPQYSFVVNDTKPIWAFCKQGNHCQQGMVFAVNPPTSGNTFDAFQASAKGLSASASASGSSSAPSASSSNAAAVASVNGAALGIFGALLALLI